MPFADRTKAQDEATPACRRPGLIAMRGDAGMEQRSRLKGVLMQKIGAEQLALDLGEGDMGPRHLARAD